MTVPPPDRVTVLFIGGLGRSGSTLLDLMLGQIPGFCAVGELSYLWARTDDDLCGCGEPFSRCPFWGKVGDAAFGGWHRIDRSEVATLRSEVDRNRRAARLILPGAHEGSTLEGRYARLLGDLYHGVAAASGASVVVDSTKHLSTALLLRTVPGVDLRVVHLVRDSRGVANSWTKRVPKTWIAGREVYMDRYPPLRTSLRWLGYNVGFHVLRAAGTPMIRMRYEDLVVDPVEEIGRALSLAGAPPTDAPFLAGRRLRLARVHTIGGNPVRFGTDALELRRDEGWRTDLDPKQRVIVTSLTLPLLAAYGYLRDAGRRGGRSEPRESGSKEDDANPTT